MRAFAFGVRGNCGPLVLGTLGRLGAVMEIWHAVVVVFGLALLEAILRRIVIFVSQTKAHHEKEILKWIDEACAHLLEQDNCEQCQRNETCGDTERHIYLETLKRWQTWARAGLADALKQEQAKVKLLLYLKEGFR